MSQLNRLNIYLFSYNRGVFLESMLRSLLTCAESISVTVIDDASTDAFTLSVLESVKDKLRVVIPKKEENAKSSNALGGLYNNMRYALEDARERNIPYALFVQDDMQLVRPITAEDIQSADKFFLANPHSAQLHTCFMKKFYEAVDEKHMLVDPSGQAYFRPLNYQGYSGFSAVGLFHVERFYALFGDFKNREYDNNAYAKENGIQMGFSVRPFMMWLPYPTSHRSKGRSIPLRLVEWAGGGGFFPYQLMEGYEIENFLSRDIEVKPYAENWLNCPPLKKVPVWSFAGGLSHLKARGGIRALLGNFLADMKKFT